MIPQRNNVNADEELDELGDDDIIECTQAGEKKPLKPTTSGTYALERPRETSRPLPRSPNKVPNNDHDGDALPSLDSINETLPTHVTDLVGNLARLADETRIPKLCGVVERSELSPSEEWLISMITTRMTVAAIMETSPLGEEETLRLLARLIGSRIITLE